MVKLDPDEAAVLAAYESGSLKSVATDGELAKLRMAAQVIGVKARSAKNRLPSRKAPPSDEPSKG